MSAFAKQRDTPTTIKMNTSGFHQNVGEGNKSLNAMSPDPLLNEAFSKGSGCARLVWHNENRVLLEGSGASTPT